MKGVGVFFKGGRCGLARSLGGKLLAGRLASGGLACGLVGTSHGECSRFGGVSDERRCKSCKKLLARSIKYSHLRQGLFTVKWLYEIRQIFI